MPTAAKSRNELSNEKKVEVLKYVKDNLGVGSRKLCLNVGFYVSSRTKDKIMRDYETNGPGDRKRHHTTDFKRSCIQVWLNREIFLYLAQCCKRKHFKLLNA